MKFSLRATDARNNYSQVMEDAVRVRPQVIRRLRDTVYWVSSEHMETMLAPCRLTLRIRQEDDGSFYGVLDELDIMDTGSDIPALERHMSIALREYAESYLAEFAAYYNSPNRRRHLPYVWRTLMQDDLEGIQGLFDAVRSGGTWPAPGRGL